MISPVSYCSFQSFNAGRKETSCETLIAFLVIIATVSKKGVVKAVKAGKTTITAKVNYKAKGAKKFANKKLKFTVKVTAKKAAATKEPAVSKTPAATASPAPAATAAPSQTPAQPTSKNGIAMYDSGKMDANLTATELMKKMGQGWNLGNTLEACGSAKETQGFTPEDFETFWQKVPTTQTTAHRAKEALAL